MEGENWKQNFISLIPKKVRDSRKHLVHRRSVRFSDTYTLRAFIVASDTETHRHNTCTHKHTHKHMHTHTHTNTHTYIHTHTHTQSPCVPLVNYDWMQTPLLVSSLCHVISSHKPRECIRTNCRVTIAQYLCWALLVETSWKSLKFLKHTHTQAHKKSP